MQFGAILIPVRINIIPAKFNKFINIGTFGFSVTSHFNAKSPE
jgi:hypothetical protein